MSTAQSGRRCMPHPHRRSLLALVYGSIGALLALPARAHDRDRANSGAARSFADLKKLGAEHQVRAIRHVHDAYRVVTADGKSAEFPESDLRFKVDSSALGPLGGQPVMLAAGRVGDRAWVIFAAPEEIGALIKQES